MKIILRSLLFFIFIIFSSCGKTDKNNNDSTTNNKRIYSKQDLPDHIKKLKNLTVYSPATEAPDTVILEKQEVFKSTPNVYLDGNISKFIVDDKNRVIIAVSKPGVNKLYIFKSDGTFLKTIGNKGKGPGEFSRINDVHAAKNKLYVFDLKLKRISIFSLEDFEFLKIISFRRDKIKNNANIASLSVYEMINVMNNRFIMMSLIDLSMRSDKGKEILADYYYINPKGQILPDKIFSHQFPSKFISEKGFRPGVALPFTMPFTRSTVIAVSNKDKIYTAWTEDFLIKVYDRSGNYERAFYYPIPKSKLSLTNLNTNSAQKKVLDEYDLPEKWPAVHRIFFDDQDRLWVFTVTDSKTNYKGWVLSKKGKLLARFNWPGKRAERFVSGVEVKSQVLVRNGYMYKVEVNVREGINQVVKYKITFKSNRAGK